MGDALVMGVDSSTQSTTIELRSAHSGELVASSQAPHPFAAPPRSETDPAAWWSALVEAAAALGDLRTRVAAVSVAGQQHGLVVLDSKGDLIRPAKLWNDTESAPQARALVNRIGADAWASHCGLVPVASFTITKLRWLVETEPENAARVAKVMLPHDWLTWRLTGEHVTDRGDASGTGWFDPRENKYVESLLALVGDISWIDRLPMVLRPEQPAGIITKEASHLLGLNSDVIVGPGTGDNMAAALGLGLQPGDVALSLGTSGTAFTISDAPSIDPTGAVAGFADATGRYLPLVCTLNATRVTDTLGAWFGVGHDELAALALKAPIGSDGVVLVPFFDGERTPNLPHAAGLIDGLRTRTSRSTIARAGYEGVICSLLNGVDALGATGVDVSGRLLLTGGGSRSPAYRQVTADLTEKGVFVPDTHEVVAAGACLQAGAVYLDQRPLELGAAWELARGTTVEPHGGGLRGKMVREAYDRRASLVG